MSRQLFIDGYNVIRQMPRFDEASLEDSRVGLIRFIEDHHPQGSPRNSVSIIFDGQEGIGPFPLSGDVRVIFSRGETADDVIKRMVEEHASARDIVLVTDDRELQRFCGGFGAEIWSVARFLQQAKTSGARRRGTVAGPDGKVIRHVLADRVNKELRALWLKDNDKKC